MKKLLFSVVLAMTVCACASADKQLIGAWEEPIPGMPGKTQGILLEKGGKASSINMATLVYSAWKREGDNLILEGKSIGNGQEINFTSQMKIEKLDNQELVLSDNGRTLHYTRAH